MLFIGGPADEITSATTEIIVPIFCESLSVILLLSPFVIGACAGGKLIKKCSPLA